jgi:hypothetical protein
MIFELRPEIKWSFVELFGKVVPNRHFFSRGLMTQGGEYMKQNEKCQSLAGYPSGHSEGDKATSFPRGFGLFQNHEKIS